MNAKQKQNLIRAAEEARDQAYAPYSGYRVGAALLTVDGTIIRGCNVENAAYGPSICAERTAVVKAVSEGWREFQAIAVVTDRGGTPCGVCRQVLNEFGPDMLVIVSDSEGKIHHELSVKELLPYGFAASDLP